MHPCAYRDIFLYREHTLPRLQSRVTRFPVPRPGICWEREWSHLFPSQGTNQLGRYTVQLRSLFADSPIGSKRYLLMICLRSSVDSGDDRPDAVRMRHAIEGRAVAERSDVCRSGHFCSMENGDRL